MMEFPQNLWDFPAEHQNLCGFKQGWTRMAFHDIPDLLLPFSICFQTSSKISKCNYTCCTDVGGCAKGMQGLQGPQWSARWRNGTSAVPRPLRSTSSTSNFHNPSNICLLLCWARRCRSQPCANRQSFPKRQMPLSPELHTGTKLCKVKHLSGRLHLNPLGSQAKVETNALATCQLHTGAKNVYVSWRRNYLSRLYSFQVRQSPIVIQGL